MRQEYLYNCHDLIPNPSLPVLLTNQTGTLMRKNPHRLIPVCITILLMTACQWLSAQTGTVKGIIRDADGKPLVGASIVVQGNKTGTSSDINGAYSLKLPPGKFVLIVSFVGQSSQKSEVV